MSPELKFETALFALVEPDRLVLRNLASSLIKDCLVESRAEAEAQLLIDGKGTACAERLSRTQDHMIKSMFAFAVDRIAGGKDNGLCLVAVGGYGRGTLAPGSDIDLLFLLPAQSSAHVNEVVEFLLYALWDARQKVGYATRNIEECLKLAKTDNTILTSILEARYICGEKYLFEVLSQRFKSEIVASGAKKFVAEKLAERDSRHAKSGESRYAVEPDLKDGKGGLRDLHTLFWIAKFIFNANSPEELAEKGAFSKSELAQFLKCEDFLWAVRCQLHFMSKRGEDRLSFDRQSELAARLKYKSHGGLKAVERFMRHYFLIAKDVGDLTRIFCASLEEKHFKEAPSISRMIAKFLPKHGKKLQLAKGFKIESGRITVVDEHVFENDPVNILRIFKLSGEGLTEIHPDALKLMRKSFRLIDDSLRQNVEANQIFLDILCNNAAPESLLRTMNEAGVLGRFIPEFGKIVAMMQFNMYHHYTVDEHLIRAVGVLTGIETGLLAKDHPLAAEIFKSIKSRRALYVATLIHDVAKGRLEDHSIAGEAVARELCPRLGLSADETDLVAWLIRYHLLMSETSQMRDLNDFKTILDFTQIVQSPERLKLLVILTVADIRAVGPGVWNGWKGQLLRTLYFEAEPILSGGHSTTTRKDRVLDAQNAFFAKAKNMGEAERQKLSARHYDAYWLNVTTERQLRQNELMSKAVVGQIMTDVNTDQFSGITEITVFTPDHPRLLSMITGACAAAGGNILGAHIFTTTDGMALDTILLAREFKDDVDESRRANRIVDSIIRVLEGRIRLREELARVQQMPERAKAFTVVPRVVVDNLSSNKNTIIEINGLDRVGLLHALTEALFHLNLNIASAHITTFGEKAVDVFYVTDLTGAKIINETRTQKIEKALLDVLAPQMTKVELG
jgi:[protein-PII] uridylyltransferase